jgi:hypothetical protein
MTMPWVGLAFSVTKQIGMRAGSGEQHFSLSRFMDQ